MEYMILIEKCFRVSIFICLKMFFILYINLRKTYVWIIFIIIFLFNIIRITKFLSFVNLFLIFYLSVYLFFVEKIKIKGKICFKYEIKC